MDFYNSFRKSKTIKIVKTKSPFSAVGIINGYLYSIYSISTILYKDLSERMTASPKRIET